jgi:hypothetical protein
MDSYKKTERLKRSINQKDMKVIDINYCNEINTLEYKVLGNSGSFYNIKIPLTIPMYILNYTNSLMKEKEIDYNFIGTITPKRKWVDKYTKNSVIKKSGYGRDKDKKYEVSEDF